MLWFLMISGFYYLYGGHIPKVVSLAAISVCLYIKKYKKENMVQVLAAKCQLPIGVGFFLL